MGLLTAFRSLHLQGERTFDEGELRAIMPGARLRRAAS